MAANVNQLKMWIFILQAIDSVLVIVLTSVAIYSVFYAEDKEYMIIACLIGLFFVNSLGRFTHKRVANMRIQMEMLLREQKTQEQRTLMATRHTTVGGTKATGIGTVGASSTKPATKK
ncbi:MAG: hypothetical protein MI865_06700 [Proteobacteria bacterium]|nr:hypothetical protein [Pseudomonadota bacterium]